MRSSLLRVLAMLAVACLSSQSIAAQESAWPKQINTGQGQVVIYQPQVESFTGNTLYGRAAMSIVLAAQEPIFGVFWFTATLQVDRATHAATLQSIKVNQVVWPSATADERTEFSQLISTTLPQWSLPISTDRLLASMQQYAQSAGRSAQLNSALPVIVVDSAPAVLLVLSGPPVLRPVAGTPYQRVVNTPLAVLFDSTARRYYLSSGWLWYSAPDILLGPWTVDSGVPRALQALVPPDSAAPGPAPGAAVPKVLVAAQPTELIDFDGPPEWTPLSSGYFLYANNTEQDVLRLIANDRVYTLLGGRWFSAATLAGPWRWVRPDSLPSAFAFIPADSPMGHVRSSVPGTQEALEAYLDAMMPQTAAIDRQTAAPTVQYDGAPQLEAIPGTTVQYAVNSPTTVLAIGGRYYALDQGVWFVAAGANGPWAVADSVPAAVATIPPTSPVYNAQFVTVYQSTPDVVYVGYTPAYLGWYPYYGTIVWGTGYVYRPWIGTVAYYPRPLTWGFAAGYHPYTGWGFGVGYSAAFLAVGAAAAERWYHGPCCYRAAWYGPAGYVRPPHLGDTYGAMRIDDRSAFYPNDPGQPLRLSNQNLYDRPSAARWMAPARTVAYSPPAAAARGMENNIYSDGAGNVYRQNSDGSWDMHQDRTWNPAPAPAPGARGANDPAAARDEAARRANGLPGRDGPSADSRRQLDDAANARSQGTAREADVQGAAARGGWGGGARGGRR